MKSYSLNPFLLLENITAKKQNNSKHRILKGQSACIKIFMKCIKLTLTEMPFTVQDPRQKKHSEQGNMCTAGLWLPFSKKAAFTCMPLDNMLFKKHSTYWKSTLRCFALRTGNPRRWPKIKAGKGEWKAAFTEHLKGKGMFYRTMALHQSPRQSALLILSTIISSSLKRHAGWKERRERSDFIHVQNLI